MRWILATRLELRNSAFYLFIFVFLLSGCGNLRFAPTEAQKQNAWLHNRTAMIAANTAGQENASDKLQQLARLSELQSRAFAAHYGLPKRFPRAETAEDILRDANIELAKSALAESAERPDVWALADSGLELAIGISALLGGVYGTRAVRFLKDAKTKSKALKEIVEGNEIFKKEHEAYASAFKAAHKDQSPQTRKIVTEMKA